MNNFPKWDDITASSTYQSLAAEEQERARRQYFDDFIAPRATSQNVDAIRSEWDSMTLPDAPDEPADDGRTWGEAAKDTVAGLMQGGASVAEGMANMADLGIRAAGLPSQMLARAKDQISGGTENLERHQREWRSPGKAMLNLTGDAVDYWKDKKSEPLEQAQQNLSRAREEADGFWSEVTGTTRALIEDPMLMGDVLSSSAAYIAFPAAASRRAGSIAWKKAVEAGKDRAQTIADATRAAMMGGAVTGGVMEGSSANIEAREQIMQMTPDQLIRGSAMYADLVAGGMGQEEAMETIAFRAGLTAQAISTPISILSSYATGGAKVEAQFFTGQGIKNFFAAVGAEAGQEALQEGGNVLGQNIGIRSFADGQRTLSEGLGQSAVLGATMGASQAGAMRLTGGLVSEIGRGLTPVMEGDNATTTDGETVTWIDDNGNQKEAKVSGYAGEVGGTHMIYAEVDGREIPVPMDQLYRPDPRQQADAPQGTPGTGFGGPAQESLSDVVQHTSDEVAAFAADRIDELNQYSDLSPEEATELRYLEANLDNPSAIATAYNVEIIPDGIIKRSRDSVEPLTDDDRASPIPDSLIMVGRQTIATTAGELTATQMLEAAGLPPVNTRVSIGGKNGVILDAFEGDRSQGAIIQMDDGTYVTRNLEDLAGQVMPEQAVEADAQLSRQEIIDRRAEVAMQEILQDIESGVVPDSVSSFEDIQNHTDANMYINDADRKDNLIGRLGREQGWSPEEYSKISNEIIAAVDSRLQARRPSAQSAARPVLQNRDRSTPAMITQMRSIAANPDYGRLGVSRDFSSGAPVVEPGANIPPARMGRTDYAVTGQGRRIPVQYAVVEASDVLPSNDAQGSVLPGYDTGVDGQSRAIAGNGRMAGLQAAYRGENAQSYRDELAQDGMHGIDPAEIQGMRNPVLVRVMPAEEVTQNIGDESNVTGTATLSASEQARNDARRLDVSGIVYSEDGQITPESARQFIQAMPASEQSGLLDGGQPSRQAYDRLSSAIFSEAYDSDALVRLQSQATDPEARTIMTALAFAAPRMATLKGQGNYDLRALVTEAAETAVNARRAGQTLSEYIKQGDISLTAETLPFLEMFAENIRSAKRIGERLSQWADALYAEATKTETDMFGDVPRISPEQITQEVIRGQENQRSNEDAGRPADEPGVAERQAPEPREQRGVEEPQEVIYRANGQPFATQKSADLAGRAREGNFDVVEVEGGWALTPSVLQYYTEAELAERAQAEAPPAARAKAPSPDDFVLSGSNAEADQAAARGQLSMFEPRRSAPHQLDMFRRMERASKIDPYAKAEQREGTTEKQRELGRSALKSLYENLTRRYRRATGDDGEISLLGAQILENFAAGKPNHLIGQKVASHADLAAVAQVYRDPRFETFRAIFVRDGEVVSEMTMTSRMPSYVTFGDTEVMLKTIRDRMTETGANGYYLMHNHPSGKSTPSNADIRATVYIAQEVPGFIQHLVIDHREYHTIDANGIEKLHMDEDLGGQSYWATPALPHPILGTMIGGFADLAGAAKQLESSLDDAAVIIMTRVDGRIVSITSVPERALSFDGLEGMAAVRRIMRTTGSGGRSFLVLNSHTIPIYALSMVDSGVFADVVAVKSGKSASAITMSGSDPFPEKAMYLSEAIKEYNIDRKIIGTDPLLAGWTMLSLNDLTFSLPISNKKGMLDIFDDGELPGGFIVAEAEELALQLEGDIEATNAWRAATPGGSKAAIYENKDSVWIDVSDVKTGEQGKRIYNYVANYAHNNGKTFIGDPAGLSPVAQSRRLENMISSALKFGTTKHLWPHDNQIKGNDQVQPINWKDGDDAHNLREMIVASHNYVTAQFPEIKNLYYNPDDDAFIHRRSGREYTREKFGDLAAFRRARAPAANQDKEGVSSPVTAGGTTLERAVFTHTLLYGTSEEQSSVLARLGGPGPQRLEGVAYSLTDDGADGSFQKLSAIHNLSAEGLIFADRLGGLAAPSVAVVKDGMMVEGFGEITLIGRRELGDPAQTPIYDADAWTARFPDPEYKKPKIKSVDELTNAVHPYGELMGDDISSTLFHELANGQDFKEAESSAFRSLGMRAMYLDQEHGIKVKPKMRQAVSSNELSAHPKVVAFFKKNQKLPYEQQYEQGAEELGRILEEVILEKYPGDARGKRIASMYVDDGKAFFGAFDRMKNEQRLVGKKVVDTPETHKTIERRMKGKEAAYKKWVNSKITEVMGEPYIRIGRSLKPFTLDNIVKHMTSHSDARGREQHMTFGAGKARASAANRFRDLAEMRNTAKDNVKSGADLEAAREKADAILDEYRSAIVDFSTYLNWKGEVDIWEALDASMMALSDGMANQLSRGAEPALKAAFKKHGFRMPDAKTMKLAVKAMNAMYEAPVPYYESKPQRAVSLNEFAGAVIPQDASPEVIAVLDKNDIPYKKYKGDGLLDAVNKFRNELSKKGEPVLFRLPDGTAAKATKRFNDQAEKVASDLRERLKALNVPDRIAVNVVEAIGSKGQKKRVSGSGIMGVIDIALNANDAVHTLNHEVIHALKSMGLFRDAEWRTLEKAARNHPRRAEIENRYAGQNLTDAQMTEEVIAEMYADWAGSRNGRGFIRTAFERVRDVLNAIAEALAGNGFLTSDSVMRRIEAGAVGERDAPRAYSPDEAAFEMAAMGSDGQEGGFSSSLPQTETPAFKKWFGDSKVVDAEGKPLVVYHGTTADITTFETSSSGEYGPGIYLSYRPESAMKWAAIAGGRGKGPATTMPVYVRMEKPFEVRKTDLQEMTLEEDADQEPIGMREVHRRLKKQGYDGIIGTGLSDSDVQIVVFDPKQIKSATGNTGAFDPNNPDIRFHETEGGADGSFTAPWSRPQYQLTPGMFNPEQARRAQQIIGGQPPSPPGPGGEVNTDIRIDPFSKSAMKLIGFFESATDKMRRSNNKDLIKLANKIDNYYNKAESRLGMVNGKIRPVLRRMGITPVSTQATVQKALQPFSEYWRHHDNGRKEQAEQIYRDSSQETRDMIDTVKDLYSDMGDINQDAGVQVFDSNLVDWAEVQKRVGANGVRIIRGQPPSRQQAKYSELLKMHSKQQDLDMDAAIYDLPRKGGWRLIGKFKKGGFWPRAIKPEVQRLLGNPDSNPELRDQLIAALINEGHIDHKSEFVKYLSLYFANEVKSDYFAGIEKARTNKLPEIFYDYSWQTFQQYSSKWSSRVSQIEQFGQQTGEGTMDAFDELIGVTNDMATRNYVGTVRDQVYNRRGTDAWSTFWSHMNILATGLQLGNPATATLNIIGGTQLNVTMFGWKRVAQAYIEVAKDWERIQQEGVELGILGKDVLNILRDADSNSGYLEDAQKVKDALSSFTKFTMTWGGYRGTENIIRTTGMIAARIQLTDALKAWNTKPGGSDAKKYSALMKRHRIDQEKLIMENGSGPETQKYLQVMVNIPQGSYRIDMTPVYVDTQVGRFFFKYQKFGTQVSRMFWQNQLQPFIAKPSIGTFLPLLHYFATAFIGGTAVLAARSLLFSYGDPGPEWEDLEEALKDEDKSAALGMIFDRAYYSMMAGSALGFFGSYVQFTKDVADQQRVRNPMDPPGLASIDAVTELVQRWIEQGRLTTGDIDYVTEGTFALYRGYKRMSLSALETVDADISAVRLQTAKRNRTYIWKTARRYAEDNGIESRKTSSGRFGKSPMSPAKQAIRDAITVGDAARAKLIYLDTMAEAPPEQRKAVRDSLRDAVRSGQPIKIAGSTSSIQKEAFLQWAKEHVSPANYQRIIEADADYRRTAVRAGIW